MPWNVKRGLLFAALGSFLVTSSAFAPNARFAQKSAASLVSNSKLVTDKAASTFWPLNYVKPDGPASSQAQEQSQKTLEDYVKDRGGDRVIRKVLIANNGMAATKSIISMRQWAFSELGDENAIEFVAIATPEDIKANAEFVRLADSYVEVPGGKNLFNYANVTVISQVAQEQRVDAVWPGWGHASENPKLPATLTEIGIKFIGPTSPVMSILGDKIAANILAQTAGIPAVPWSGSFGGPNDGPLVAELTAEGTIPEETFEKGTCRTVEEALEVARRIGYDNGIMIKASEGGGGKGIRLVYSEEDLPDQFLQVQNEVIGSPIFLMQLCQNNRHIEIQIVGDQHGNAAAFSGRDCSTQRRFQKIFEEAPPRIVPPETFREMEKNALKLTQSIGYQGAGTVEYLYNADENKFYFLELNPRLQVEHPVTESITNVNLPATQLQCAMGIPLYNIPEVRRFYGRKDIYGTDCIDFLEEEYPKIDKHCIAARITAENPDEGFKPTAGTIERIKFQSASNVWGYFAYGPNGGIHEYADSQFGHVFAKGDSREESRKALIMTLKEMEVRGEIRTTFEYLEQLLETEEFKNNEVTTSWLDGLLKEKVLQASMDPHQVITSAAVFRAVQHVKEETEAVKESFEKGQVSTSMIGSISSFGIEIPYKSVRYPFHVEMIGPDVYRFTLAGQSSIDIRVREDPGGALIATFGGQMHRIIGRQEALGVRLNLDGQTILMPNILDPSELRTDVTGKIVRYLHENGAVVEKDTPYVEVEAMKMIMTMKTTEAGKITQALSPGTVIAAGDLLASLELKDPSKVENIETFDGKLDIENVPVERKASDVVSSILGGFKNDPEAATQNAFAEAGGADAIIDLVISTVNEYVRIEKDFDGKVADDVVHDLTKAKAENLDLAINEIRAHQQRKMRLELVHSMLRYVSDFRARWGIDTLPPALLEVFGQLTALKEKAYGDVKLLATSIIEECNAKPFDGRVADLRSQLQHRGADLAELAFDEEISAGVDLLTFLFNDEDKIIRANALEVYIRRIHRSRRLIDIHVEEVEGRLTCSWKYQYMEQPASAATVRHGMLAVVPDFSKISVDLPSILNGAASKMDAIDRTIPFFAANKDAKPVNELYIAAGTPNNKSLDIKPIEELIGKEAKVLKMLGACRLTILQPLDKQHPAYYTFPSVKDWKEEMIMRDVRPTYYNLLELNRCEQNFELERLHSVGKSVQVYAGLEKTEKPFRGGPSQVVFVRVISGSQGFTSLEGAERALVQGLDELERAQSSSKVDSVQSSSRLYLHSYPPLKNTTPEEVSKQFKEIMGVLKSRYANRLLKLRVDEVEVLLRMEAEDSQGEFMTERARFISSSLEGEWLKTKGYAERYDPESGFAYETCITDEDDDDYCLLDYYEASNDVQTKRSMARKVGSTYAYDFLGLLEVGLLGQWNAHLKSLSTVVKDVPSNYFQAKELIEGKKGELILASRPIGTNKVGMLAWHVTMKTPEYPEGREIVLIANDVTVKSGSFSVAEDEIYYKASEYARKRSIPRIYISCNAGARIGLYEDLKSKIKLKLFDSSSPTKGFEYLYISDEDYKTLPEGAVLGHKVEEGWAIDDIIGTTFGIGVENLQGSGKIAGETSQAYDDVFTLSYVTGRSVGIGAYLVRLGQRIIQKTQGPIILTGYSALNKLLGREVYSSQDQLGGPQIMVPNGVTHLEVDSDQDGVAAMLEWLSFVPKNVGALPACRECADPVGRNVQWRPTKTPYDPRLMMAGTTSQRGFFDKGTFKEYLGGWGKTVVVGRARLGGIPMGAIAVETRGIEKRVPADPANPSSSELIQPQAGQVLYPDSSYKTAQSIRDFNKEGLPIMIFANWRGFSGGSRDMYGEILKFGSMIVDALREYEHPVYIYMPPHAELRGGSWVVVDPTINLKQMEMYADPDSRGGILEPNGIAEIKFRAKDQLSLMHSTDPELKLLDAELATVMDGTYPNAEARRQVEEEIKEREALLRPVFLQAATEFCDLHDKTGRMKAVGVIRAAVPWERSREYFFNRAKRRMVEDDYTEKLKAASDGVMDDATAKDALKAMALEQWDDDASMLEFYGYSENAITSKIKRVRADAIKAKIDDLDTEFRNL